MAHEEIGTFEMLTGQEHKLLGSTFGGQHNPSNLPIETGTNNPWIVPQGIWSRQLSIEEVASARRERGYIITDIIRLQSDKSPFFIGVRIPLVELDPVTGETLRDPYVDENEIAYIDHAKETIDPASMTTMRLTADLYAFWGRDFDVYPRHGNRE